MNIFTFYIGYKAHIPGINSANIFGQSYAKTTAVAVKDEYCNKVDLPPNERYQTISKQYFTKPKIRSIEEGNLIIIFFKIKDANLKELALKRNKSVTYEPRNYVPCIAKKEFGRDPISLDNVPSTFIEKLGLEKKTIDEVNLYIFMLKNI